MSDASVPLALYLHIPFCRQRCSYCAFNTYAGLDGIIPVYVDALCRELALVGAAGSRPAIRTVYFGGGTPSLLPAQDVARILEQVRLAFAPVGAPEVTLEANPGAVGEDYFRRIREAGVNRLSLGAQSYQATDLKLFRRVHVWQDVVAAVAAARQARFDNLSLDLIYGAPGQDLPGWRASVEQAVALQPEHLSLYSLGLEPGTAMYGWVERGMVSAPDPDLAADMYELAGEILTRQGYEQYEISNWARPGYACRHNLQYWLREPYLGFGAGAHGFAVDMRYAVVASPQEYIHRLSGTLIEGRFPLSPAVAVETIEVIDPVEARAEYMLLGLRLTHAGVSRPAFARRFGLSLEECYPNQLRELESLGLIEALPDCVRLTARGRLLGNYAFAYFV
jgi:oxygen-independent coproporphyrinogen-3 oxidase